MRRNILTTLNSLYIFKETETIVLDGDDTPKVEQLVGVPAGLPPNSVAVTGAPPPAGVPMLPQFGQPVPGKHTKYNRLVMMLRCSSLI